MTIRFTSLFLLVFGFSYTIANAQLGGRASYQFLNVPVNTRISGLGGINISQPGIDINLMTQNPATLSDSLRNYLSINYLPYLADIKATMVNYAFNAGKTGTWGVGMRYFDYGTFSGADLAGNSTGDFKSKEYAFTVAKSHTINHFTLGASLNLAFSQIGTYNSAALLTDVGGIFRHPQRDWAVGLVIKNVGVPLKKYVPGEAVDLPTDVQLGTSFKPEHMPVRMSLTAHHLHKWDIVYDNPNQKGKVDLNGNEIKEKVSFGSKLLTHFAVGAEFLMSRNFQLRAGYNFLRRKELKEESKSGGAGLSIGGMVRIKYFEFAYTRSFYYIGTGTNHFTLTTDFNRILKKKI